MALTKVTSNVLNDNAVTTAKINAAAVTNPKIGPEFTTVSALTAGATVAMDYTAAQVFTLTPNANTTINITNPVIGVTKVLIMTGAGGSNTLAFYVGCAAGTFNKI